MFILESKKKEKPRIARTEPDGSAAKGEKSFTERLTTQKKTQGNEL